jgi:phage terminase large subunit-like protein
MTRSQRDARASLAPPFPVELLDELTVELASLTPPVILDDSWRDCPPLFCTPPPEGADVWFDVAAVVRACAAMVALRHVKGALARTPLVPDPWQIVWVIAPVFGWRYSLDHERADLAGTRCCRRAWIEVPRKNGKTTLCSAFALILLCADDEPGAEVYAAATSRDQARQCFDPAKIMAVASPLLAPRIKPLRDVLRYVPTGSFFRVLSRVADAAHGLNVHGAVVDEIHVHQNRDLIDAIETGVGARRQPLVVCITTADEGEDFTIYAEKRAEVVRLAERHAVDRNVWGVIWASPDHEDPFDPAVWSRCNPGLGRSVSLAYLEGEARKAANSPSYKPTFLRLALNRRTRQTHRWLDIADYDQLGNAAAAPWQPRDGMFNFPAELKGRRAWAGIDLSAVSDLTALGLWIPDDADSDLSSGWSYTWAWLPEEGLSERVEADGIPYDTWAVEGWLSLTEGNTVDYGPILDTVRQLGALVRLEAVGLDRWQAHRIMQEITAARSARVVVELPQTYQGLSGGCKVIERSVRAGRFRHGGNPLKRWSYSTVEVRRDELDNLKPVKPDRGKTAARIDPVMADVIAAAVWERRERRKGTASGPRPGPGRDSILRPQRKLAL